MELHKNSLTYTTFVILALAALEDPNNPRTRPELVGLVQWPCHMARALLILTETQDGPRPFDGWAHLLRQKMGELGARPHQAGHKS